MRIVSFLPSATEILYALGCGSQIVGVTHECDYPPAARRKPRIIQPSFSAAEMTSRQIDETVSDLARGGKEIFLINEKLIRESKPDLIIGQGICEVCAPHTNELTKALSICKTEPDVLVLNPTTLEGIFDTIMQIAQKVGKEQQGKLLVGSLKKRIESVRRRPVAERKLVLCLEWLDPLFTAGHWVPEMVQIAGGTNGISSTGDRSKRFSFEQVSRLDPDVIMLMPCGFDVSRTICELGPLSSHKEWKSLRSVENGDVYALDSNSYFSKPGPRVVTGLEILAKILGSDAKVPKGSYKRVEPTASARLRYKRRPVS